MRSKEHWRRSHSRDPTSVGIAFLLPSTAALQNQLGSHRGHTVVSLSHRSGAPALDLATFHDLEPAWQSGVWPSWCRALARALVAIGRPSRFPTTNSPGMTCPGTRGGWRTRCSAAAGPGLNTFWRCFWARPTFAMFHVIHVVVSFHNQK